MKIVNVAELEGAALDWGVAVAVGSESVDINDEFKILSVDTGPEIHYNYSPSTDWSQGGPLIEELEFGLLKNNDGSWSGIKDMAYAEAIEDYPWSPTPLIAACRAIVAAKFGDTVEVLEELL